MGAEVDVSETSDPPSPSGNDGHLTAKPKDTAVDEETDDFGLPRKDYRAARAQISEAHNDEEDSETFHDAQDVRTATPDVKVSEEKERSIVQPCQNKISKQFPKDSKSIASHATSCEDSEMPLAKHMGVGDNATAAHATAQVQSPAAPLEVSATLDPEPSSITTRDTSSIELSS